MGLALEPGDEAKVGSTPQPKRNHYLDVDSADTPAEGTYSAQLYSMSKRALVHQLQPKNLVMINDVPVNMEIRYRSSRYHPERIDVQAN